MWFFKKKQKAPTAAEQNALDKEIIEKNAKLSEAIIAWVKDEQLRKETLALREELAFLIPSHKDAVIQKDNEIMAKIEKILTLLNDSATTLGCAEFANLITDIKAFIKIRNAEV